MAFRFISSEQVRALLTPFECIKVMRHATAATSAGLINVPPRLYFPPFEGEAKFFGLMPGSSELLKYYGAKVLSEHRGNASKGLPTIQGGVLLFDHESGEPAALIDAASVTEIRTAAASALATDILAAPTANRCGIFGTGAQAIAHIDAINTVRPLGEIIIYGRNYDKAVLFAGHQAQRTGLKIKATKQPEEAAACEIICTVTSSKIPILKGEWVTPGSHVNLVGAYSKDTREADTNLITKSTVYVDYLESCFNEAGDILIPVSEGAITRNHVLGEIGQVINNEIEGRQNDQQITLYKSLGFVAQDLFVGQFVLDKLLTN